MLSVENVHVTIQGKRILRGVSFVCEAGSIFTVIGQNGAGKSTLLRAVLGSVPVEAGAVCIDGKEVLSIHPKQRARSVAYLPQSAPGNQRCSVEEFVRMGNYPWQGYFTNRDIDQRINRALTLCEVECFRERMVCTLSGGERQRVLLAQVIMQYTPVILLDEPTLFLDLKHQILFETILLRLRDEGKAIVNVSHDLYGSARVSTQAALLKDGEIVRSGVPEEIFTPEMLAEGFDVDEKTIQERVTTLQPGEVQ